MASYRERRSTGPDFRVRYRLLSEGEGGRQTLPFLHIRSDFLYEGDDPLVVGIWCIWPEFVSANGAVFPDDQRVPAEGLADMYIVNDAMRAQHASRIQLGTRGYFVEGPKKTATCEVVAVLSLGNAER